MKDRVRPGWLPVIDRVSGFARNRLSACQSPGESLPPASCEIVRDEAQPSRGAMLRAMALFQRRTASRAQLLILAATALSTLALYPFAAALADAPATTHSAEPAAKQPTAPPTQPATTIRAASGEVSKPAPADQAPAALIERGAKFLLSAQGPDGGWTSKAGPGISALVVKALAQTPSVGPQHAAVARGVDFVLSHRREDGGVYGAEGLLKNYESSVTLSMLAALPRTRHAERIQELQRFLIKDQWDESEDIKPDNPFYGGAGYGRGKRPDLSNTQMMVEALHDSGLPKDDPAYAKALTFIRRCQMLGESNDQPFARGSMQGGFIYSPANGGESKAGEIEVGARKELRCYGSMSYSGYKSLLYVGLRADDPRVLAAREWIAKNWTLSVNPNMPGEQSREGLYYYYHVLARALAIGGEAVITDAQGRKHDWRRELSERLADLQRPDGSWTNAEDRWMEGDPQLVTAYVLLALQAAYPPTGGQ